MKFEFDPTQRHQLAAIEATVGLFEGQTCLRESFALVRDCNIGVVPNRLTISAEPLLENLQAVQAQSALAVDRRLEMLGNIDDSEGFPNYTVEMETGTGKTYVYLRTALELSRRFGFTKFIIVVPTIAIRAGVISTLNATVDHFSELYGDIPYRSQVYDSRAPGRVRQFAGSLSVEFLIMTIDSFNKENNRFFVPADHLHGETPLKIVQDVRPILILDEPQNMGSQTAVAALARLNPLFALRYSATHKDQFNLVYRLTPAEAYRGGLVKRVEVAGVERELDANRPFLQVISLESTRRSVSARICVHQRTRGGVSPKRMVVRAGTDLEQATGRPEYRNYIVDEINPAARSVRFVNNVELAVGDVQGTDQRALFDSQIRYTIREHFLKQRRIRSRGVKVLSLFFIDRVANYTGPEGLIRSLFEKAFDDIKIDFEEWRDLRSDQVQAAYFATEAVGGRREIVDTTTASTARDNEAFELIMNKKEQLLSFDEPVAFIFSHSALREGWDNPNVCQICTLNHAVSEIRKRQEIGRGVRLVVDQTGKRLWDAEVNVLTVVANESYESYISSYQEEIAREIGTDAESPRIENARGRLEVRLTRSIADIPALQQLWDRIRRKTRFTVRIDVDSCIPAIVRALDGLSIQPVRVRVSKGRIVAKEDSSFGSQAISGKRTLALSMKASTVDAVIDKVLELLTLGPMPLRLTRRSILKILVSCTSQDIALANSHAWASALVKVIREQLADRLSESTEYRETGAYYDISQFEPLVLSWADRVIPSKRGIYDHTIYDSGVERSFAEHLDNDARTEAYFKFPPWFAIDTPLGSYTPDWAVARREVDEHGSVLRTVCFVAETKATLDQSALRPTERYKIECARRHFESIGVMYRAVTSLTEYDLLDSICAENLERTNA